MSIPLDRILSLQLQFERASAFGEASKHFKKNNITGRGAAAYYADKGHSITSEMKKENEKAMYLSIYANNQSSN